MSIQDIIDNKVYIGSLKNESHPKTSPYWLDVMNGLVVLDPESIIEQMEGAKEKIQAVKKAKGSILLICEKKMYSEEAQALCEKHGYSYLVQKTPGGFLTNFDTLIKRIESLNEMAAFMKSDNFQALTKKEQLISQRKFDKINRVYKGAKNLKKRPDLVLVVDGAEMGGIINEIEQTKVESIVLASSNYKRYFKKWDIVANVMSYKSLGFVLNYILS